ncbi:MAG: hypothetical protein U0231_20150 [Nitrospiraceae bacterium]
MTYPSYWHYNVLRGLDYLGSTPYIRDSRLKDPLGVILGDESRMADGQSRSEFLV